ncbi:hypothetical protein Tco_0008450 [Tanacetum coccineum]
MGRKVSCCSQRIKSICNDEDDSIHFEKYYSSLFFVCCLTSSPPVLPTREPEDSLIMGDEHLDTIPEKESDELIKFSVENFVPIPSESEDFSDNESECDVPECDETSPIFTTFSNPLFDSNEDFTSSEASQLNDKEFDYLLRSFSPVNSLISIQFYRELRKPTLIWRKKSILLRICLYDNSSPRPPEELNLEIADTIFESLSPSPILVEDSDSLMEEIDLFLASDDSMPPGIEDDDYDSELRREYRFLEELFNMFPFPSRTMEVITLIIFNDTFPSRPPSGTNGLLRFGLILRPVGCCT